MVSGQPQKGAAARESRKAKEDLQRDEGGSPHAARKSKRQLDRELDKELMDSFPSSDPPAAAQPQSSEPAGDPKTKP